jgi:hypothetical protein
MIFTIFEVINLLFIFLNFFVEKFTYPEIKANKVSSFPFLTFFPGWYFVPLCLIMIEPFFAYWPSESLTPSLLLFESRPSDEDPPAFLCAILYYSTGNLINNIKIATKIAIKNNIAKASVCVKLIDMV